MAEHTYCIIPRRGTYQLIKSINEKAKFVNSDIRKFCRSKENYHFLDNDQLFFSEGRFRKTLFDARDPSGVHVSDEGAEELYDSFLAFFYEGESDELEPNELMPITPSAAETRKRARGSSSSTPSSANRKSKQGRIDA